MNSSEIDNLIVEKTKAIVRAAEALNDVQSEIYKVKKNLVELTEAQRQARFNISRMKAEKEVLEREFWQSRNQ